MPKGERRNASRVTKGKQVIWQRQYWEHLIRDDRDYEQHMNYIHFNPVKHGYATRASDWPYSSIHRYIARGMVGADRGVGIQENQPEGFGERR